MSPSITQLLKYPRVMQSEMVTQKVKQSFVLEIMFEVNSCWSLITVAKSQHGDTTVIQMPGRVTHWDFW